jgi:type VI secretion system ImpC/EvpB family protein/type VI secretion system ImpB/VipA family protein
MTLERGYKMTESVQKKLLRVRPPRVKITYDVETGGALEKKELPFIVGIFADLKGDREDPATYDSLKSRGMTDIDRDNFNDVMATIKPRVVLSAVKQTDPGLLELMKDTGDNAIVFPNIDAFEPMKVILALPSLKSLYGERSQIRDLQSKAEGDDAIANVLDTLIENATPAAEGTPALAEAAVTDCAGKLAPILQLDAEKSAAALAPFVSQLNLYFTAANATASAKITQAKRRGTIAVMDELVTLIDQKLSSALSAIMHCPMFQKMEATWRGLAFLVMNTETSNMLKLKVFNATKEELCKDMLKAVEFDQSTLFKLIYEAEYGTYGGHPYSMLIGDYAIGNSGDDMDFLGKMAEVAAAAHAPFIAQASQDLFRLSGFDKLDKPRDLKKIFEGGDLIGWQAFREQEDARYVTLVLPRALLRLPYGSPEKRNTTPCEGINFDEQVSSASDAVVYSADGGAISYGEPEADHFLWGNPAYMLGERITNAFSLYSWTAAIRGVEGGGLVEGLPSYTYTSCSGSIELFCPTEISITDRREKELNDLGFISLCHCKGTSKAAFFGGQTTNLPKKYFSDSANANAKISAMLPYMLAASRFAHYIKVIMRDKIGSFQTRGNIESYLNSWISNYVLLDDNASQEVKAGYPLREANVVVTEVPGEPGSYRATVFLKPHFQLEELTTSIRLVANLPK